MIEYNLSDSSKPKPAKSVQSYKDELNRLNIMYQKGRISEEYYETEYEKISAAMSNADDQSRLACCVFSACQ